MAGNIGKAVRIYGYARSAKSTSEYATKMNRLSNQIFGEVARPTTQEGMTIVERLSSEPHELREHRTQYYPAVEEATELCNILREYGLFRDEAADFKEEMLRARELRGRAKIRPMWKDGIRPVKKVEFRYDD